MANDIANNMVETIHQLENELAEVKRLLKLAVESLERLGSNEICFSGCDESCPFDCVGRLEEKHWKYLDEALKLIKEE